MAEWVARGLAGGWLPRRGVTRTQAAATATTAAVAYVMYYLQYVKHRPQLSYMRTPLNEQILLRCPALRETFYPTPLLAGAHAQTVVAAVRGLGTFPLLDLDRQLLQLPCGGTVALDWLPRPRSPTDTLGDDTPVVLVLHGLTGGTCEPHVRWLLKMAQRRRWRAVLLNSRGCSGSPLTTPQPYTAGYTGDVFAAVAELRRQLPHAPLLAVGVSLGASILTKYLAEAADTEAGAGLVAAASVSNPMDLTVLPTGVQRDPKLLWPYLVVLSVRLYHYMVVHWSMLKTHPKLQHLTLSKMLPHALDVTHFEDEIIVPLFGFADRAEYYRDASSVHYVARVRTPTLFFASADDPFIRVHPHTACATNPATILALTERGGHCAFLEGLLPTGHTRMTRSVAQFFAAVLALSPGASPLAPHGWDMGSSYALRGRL